MSYTAKSDRGGWVTFDKTRRAGSPTLVMSRRINLYEHRCIGLCDRGYAVFSSYL